MAVSALAHGVFQGGMTAATGGKFWAGFAAGAVSSIAASFWQGGQEEGFFKENNWAYGVKNVHEGLGSMLGMNNAFGTIVFGTIMGGAASALAGGNFWQGAVTGMIVSGLNHALHDGNNYESEGEGDPPTKMKPASAYDYSQETIPGKFTDDWNYILNGDKGNPFSRYGEIFCRDWGQASTGDKVGLALAATPFRIIRFGKFTAEAKLFHSAIKPNILKAAFKNAGKFEHIVGTNPDVIVKGTDIFLTGAKYSPFYGKTFATGLKATEFFK